jgi:hypothetical protein
MQAFSSTSGKWSGLATILFIYKMLLVLITGTKKEEYAYDMNNILYYWVSFKFIFHHLKFNRMKYRNFMPVMLVFFSAFIFGCQDGGNEKKDTGDKPPVVTETVTPTPAPSPTPTPTSTITPTASADTGMDNKPFAGVCGDWGKGSASGTKTCDQSESCTGGSGHCSKYMKVMVKGRPRWKKTGEDAPFVPRKADGDNHECECFCK